MKKILAFMKREAVLTVSGVLALISVFIVPPDKNYISYCNFSVLALLFCLMAIVEGVRRCALFEVLTQSLTKYIKTEKYLILALCLTCFFSSAVLTNDVALITFVPFSLALLKNKGEKTLIFTVTMETVAANLGSLITPIGNPQNLYLYSHYEMEIGEFFRATLPLGGICLLIVTVICLLRKNEAAESNLTQEPARLNKRGLAFYGILFILCLLTVLGILHYGITFAITLIAVLIKDRGILKKVDYLLLLTFIFFFIFVGNIARLDLVQNFITRAIKGREILVSALLSQIISNVPAAAMLSAFTDNARGLILGTNIGGLGTLIASMASLISFRLLSTVKISSGKYLLFFSAVNFSLLTGLLLIYIFLL